MTELASEKITTEADTASLVKHRLVSIDCLRGIAVFGVVCVHIPNDAPGGWRQNPWFLSSYLMQYGYWGVPLFILLSGFCIHRRAAINKARGADSKIDWLAFWKRRFWRLYPPYLAAIALGLIIPATIGILETESWGGTFTRRYFHLDLLTHLFMIHNLTPEYVLGLRNGVYWTLGLEEQLYAIYPVCLLLLARYRASTTVLIGISVSIIWRLASPAIPEIRLIEGLHIGNYLAFPFAYWGLWILGAVAVDTYFHNTPLPRMASSSALAAGLLSIALIVNQNTVDLFVDANWVGNQLLHQHRHSIEQVGSVFVAAGLFVLLQSAVRNERKWAIRNRVSLLFAAIGRASYSIYLVHFPIILLVDHCTNFGNTGIEWAFRTLTHLCASFGFGFGFYWLVEMHFLGGQCPLVVARFWQRTKSSLSSR